MARCKGHQYKNRVKNDDKCKIIKNKTLTIKELCFWLPSWVEASFTETSEKQAYGCQTRTWTEEYETIMWANAQRDGRPAEYRWCPLFNAAKFGWRPLLECLAVTLSRLERRWNLQGCPKLANISQPLGGRSSPYSEDMWGRYRCLTSFFRLSIHASAAKIQPDKVVRWCQNGDFFASCI